MKSKVRSAKAKKKRPKKVVVVPANPRGTTRAADGTTNVKKAPVRPAKKRGVAGVGVLEKAESVPHGGAALPGAALPGRVGMPALEEVNRGWVLYSDHPVARVLQELGLTAMRGLFVVHYLWTCGGNGAEAVRWAGYTPEAKDGQACKADRANQAAHAILTNPDVQSALARCIPLIYGPPEHGLELELWEGATKAEALQPVWVPSKYDKDGDLVSEGFWATPPEVPDYAARVKFREKMVALSQGRKSESTEAGGMRVVLVDRSVSGDVRVLETPMEGVYPPKE